MIDSTTALITYLKTKTSLTTIVGTKIYSPRLPEGFAVNQAVTLIVRGGETELNVDIIKPSYQFKCWGSTPIEARAVYRALADVMNEIKNQTVGSAYIYEAIEETHGQDLIDPDTEWFYTLAFFEITCRR